MIAPMRRGRAPWRARKAALRDRRKPPISELRQPHPGAASLLRDKLDARLFEGLGNRLDSAFLR